MSFTTPSGKVLRLSLVVAMARNGLIGRGGALPWHITEDLRFFKSLTTGHTVLMGRTTFNSIGKALPRRLNLVLTSDKHGLPTAAELIACSNAAEALALAAEVMTIWGDEIFVIGGAKVYASCFEYCDRSVMTQVNGDFEGDTFFPEDILAQIRSWPSQELANFPEASTPFRVLEYRRP